MLQDAIMPKHSLLINPEKSFELPIYANQMASAFAKFGCSKPKCCKDTYAVDVLLFIDRSTLEGRESSKSSSSSDSRTESI